MATILLVEDNDINRDMLSRRLIKRGFTLLIAVDGREAVTIAHAELPELILLDMSLPVLSGWDTARELKSSAETRDIPIIALTAHAMESDRKDALQAGCDYFTTKPVEFAVLLDMIQSGLSDKNPV